MYVEIDSTRTLSGDLFAPESYATDSDEALPSLGDYVDLSDEALDVLNEDDRKPAVDDSYTLKELEQRINVVLAQIDQIWGSGLPDDEKNRQISALQSEVALLRGGQSNYLKSRMSKSV